MLSGFIRASKPCPRSGVSFVVDGKKKFFPQTDIIRESPVSLHVYDAFRWTSAAVNAFSVSALKPGDAA